MDAASTLTLVLIVSAIVACAAVAWASIEAARAFKSTRDTSDRLRERIVPLLDKLDITVDAANAELLRVDAVITRLEDATARVGAASETIAEIVHAPREAVGNIAEKVRQAWRNRKSAKADHEDEAQPCA